MQLRLEDWEGVNNGNWGCETGCFGDEHNERMKLVLCALDRTQGPRKVATNGMLAYPRLTCLQENSLCILGLVRYHLVSFYCIVSNQLASQISRWEPAVSLSLGRIVIKHAVRVFCVSRQIDHPAASFGTVDPAVSNRAILSLLAVDAFELDLTVCDHGTISFWVLRCRYGLDMGLLGKKVTC